MKTLHGLLGVGSPLVDLSATVPETVLRQLPGAKGGTVHLTDAGLRELASRFSCRVASGGAAANTVQAAARLGTPAALLGKLGDDAFGQIFRQDMQMAGARTDLLLISPEEPTGFCLALVTPDGERTMCSSLGASATLTEAELDGIDFRSCEWVLLEGYMLETAFFEPLMKRLMTAKCRLAMDLSSFELASRYREKFTLLLQNSVELLFANEEEAAALLGTALPPAETLAHLNELVPLAVLKCGARGAYAGARGQGAVRIEARAAGPVIDTTAAGDYFAAGFLHGLLAGWDMEKSGRCGALLAGEIVAVTGARLPEERWQRISEKICSTLGQVTEQ